MSSFKLNPKYSILSKSDRLYNIDCPIVGLTGGIATGKSTVSSLLRKQGHHIIDADALVKSVYQNSKTIDFIQKYYPQSVDNSGINFKKLREIFFSDKKAKEEIEKLIYSQMPTAFVTEYNKFNNPNFIFYDVPLLFEKGLDKLVDVKMLVYCSREIQVQRVMKRDAISAELANKIIDSQISIEEKARISDIVIDNSGEIDKINLPTEIWS